MTKEQFRQTELPLIRNWMQAEKMKLTFIRKQKELMEMSLCSINLVGDLIDQPERKN